MASNSDTVSAFATVSLGQMDSIYEDATFLALLTAPDDMNEKDIVVLEIFNTTV